MVTTRTTAAAIPAPGLPPDSTLLPCCAVSSSSGLHCEVPLPPLTVTSMVSPVSGCFSRSRLPFHFFCHSCAAKVGRQHACWGEHGEAVVAMCSKAGCGSCASNLSFQDSSAVSALILAALQCRTLHPHNERRTLRLLLLGASKKETMSCFLTHDSGLCPRPANCAGGGGTQGAASAGEGQVGRCAQVAGINPAARLPQPLPVAAAPAHVTCRPSHLTHPPGLPTGSR